MKQTHTYTSEQYRRDTGFPLVWMCTCCISRSTSAPEEEAEEHFQQRNDARAGKIIGKPYKSPGTSMKPMKPQQQHDAVEPAPQ
jgi:hypothetical protein